MSAVLHIQLLGRFRLRYGDDEFMGIATPRLHALLAYLLLHREAAQPRQHIAYLFWPDSPESQARTNLRHLLHQVHRALPDADQFLEVTGQTLRWRLDALFELDVAAFEHAVQEGLTTQTIMARQQAYERAVSLYGGDLLPGHYDDWILRERERLQQLFAAGLEHLIDTLEARREYRAAIDYTRRLLRVDPLQEVAYRRLMRLYALSGDRGAALRIYQVCCETLQRELGAEPDAETRHLYERLKEAKPRPAAQPDRRPASTLIGRDAEWQSLMRNWAKASRGQAAMVLIIGEAGIGKTRLAEELAHWADRQGMSVASAHCYTAEGRLTYAPALEWLRAAPCKEALQTLPDAWRSELAFLLPELQVGRPSSASQQVRAEPLQRQRLFEAMARTMLGASQPLLLLIDDLHWCDRDTLEWLHYLLRFDPRARLLVVGTLRREEALGDHPVAVLLSQLGYADLLAEIPLRRLAAPETAALAAAMIGHGLRDEQAADLYAETEGNPLFVVETVRAGTLTRGTLNAPQTASPRAGSKAPLPPRIQALIATRLGGLSVKAREVAGVAAAIGRTFRLEVLAEASESNDAALVRALDDLLQHGIVRDQGSNIYDFSHDRIRDAAYEGLSTARRSLVHRRIAAALETIHADDLDAVSGQIAAHYDRAGLAAQAIPYYRRAAQVAHRLAAVEEAISHLNRALALLLAQPETPQRVQQELALQVALGAPLIAARGYTAPELERAFNRAQELCQQIGETPQLFQVLWGLGRFYLVRPQLDAAVKIGQRLLAQARRTRDPDLLLEAHNSLGAVRFHRGELRLAREHLERGFALYNPERHRAHALLYGQDPGVVCLIRGAWALWCLGYPQQALERSQQGIALAERGGHLFSLAFALSYGAMVHLFRREPEPARATAEAGIAVSAEHGYPLFHGMSAYVQGWTMTQQGQLDEGMAQMRRGLTTFRATGAELGVPYFLAQLAALCARAGQIDEAEELDREALAILAQTGEGWFETFVLLLHGETLLYCGVPEVEAATSFRRAVAAARRRRARSFELQALLTLIRRSLAADEEIEALADLVSTFAEGLDTPDLAEARNMLRAGTPTRPA
jgi:DNA-binding SARP family transcriptional activator/predicted ATPase